jgi:hypothetical protein
LRIGPKDDAPGGGREPSRDGKMPLAGGVEIVGNKPGRVRLAAIQDYSATRLRPFIQANVAEGATAKTDGRSAYPGAPDVDHDPHAVGKMTAHVVVPWIHRVFATPKTWALGVYYGLRRPHLHAYPDNFVFRFNSCRTSHAAFRTFLGIATRIKPATYTMLIAPQP